MLLSRRELLNPPAERRCPLDDFWPHVHRYAMACHLEITTLPDDPCGAPAAGAALDIPT